MLSAALLTSSFLLLSNSINGGSCDFTAGSVRVYKFQGTILGYCPPPSEIDANLAPDSPQNAFLIQSLPNVLTSQGFRTKLSPFPNQTTVVGLIAATVPQTTGVTSTLDARYYTQLSPLHEEVIISVTGTPAAPQLVFAYGFGGNNGSYRIQTNNLSPLDISGGVLELDARVSFNKPGDRFPNMVNVTVCTQRGAGNCYLFKVNGTFGSASPEFYLGTMMSEVGTPNLRARYCNLPSFESGTGYTDACPASDQGSSTGTGTF